MKTLMKRDMNLLISVVEIIFLIFQYLKTFNYSLFFKNFVLHSALNG